MSFVVARLIKLSLPLVLFALLVGCGDSSPSRSSGSYGPPATYSISGSITPAATSAVDGDLNNPSAPFSSNDDPTTAQNLSNPVVLGGYATAIATGNTADRFGAAADLQDWYRLTLAAGQVITLTISDHDGDAANTANPDFDLFLVDPVTLADVQTSEGLGRQEVITVLADGDYDVQVFAFNSGSNYVLSVGQTPAAVSGQGLHLEDEFVPGEAIVRFKNSAAGSSGVTPLSVSARETALGLQAMGGRPGEARLYSLSSLPAVQTLAVTGIQRRSKTGGNAWQQAKRDTLDRVKALRQRADVASADLNYIRRPLLIPDDSLFSSQWNASLVNLPQAWDLTTGAAGVVVAVLDNGILPNHPDLAGRFCAATDGCAGYDFVADPISGADGDGIDPDPTDPGDHSLPDGSSFFHGTFVSGAVGAVGNNAIGVAGVDWTARIMPLRVLGVGVGTSYDVIQGVRYAAGLSNDSGSVPLQPAGVLNLSLGGGGFSQAEQDLYTQLHTQGILVVAAAGNDASSLPSYPAAYDGVVSVSAVDIDKNLAPYSNVGASIDVTAPGGNLATDRNGDGIADGILSTGGDDTGPLSYNYLPVMGTSMAAPQVAGIAALMLAADPALTAAEFDTLLAAGSLTQDLAGDGAAVRNESFGYGLIDAQKAVLAALNLAGGGALPASLAITPSYLNFGATSTSLPLTLSNAGGGALNVTNVSFTAPWITGVTLTSETPVGSGLGDYSVTIDRTGLADGVYSATLTVTTDLPGTAPVSVLMQVGVSGAADVGLQTVYLLDPASGNRLKSLTAAVDPVNGTYNYSFSGLSPGSYMIEAGTDADNDGQICDPGEACGGYPLLTEPAVIEILNADKTGIDFSSSFDGNR